MLVKPELEKVLPKVDNRYTLAVVIAKRVRQLVDGALPLAESESPNLVTIACEELAADKIVCVKGQVKPYIPLKPEIEAARMAARAEEEQAHMADAVKDALDQAAGIEAERKTKPEDVQLVADNLITLTETLTDQPSDDTYEEVVETESQTTETVTESDETESISENNEDEETQ